MRSTGIRGGFDILIAALWTFVKITEDNGPAVKAVKEEEGKYIKE